MPEPPEPGLAAEVRKSLQIDRRYRLELPELGDDVAISEAGIAAIETMVDRLPSKPALVDRGSNMGYEEGNAATPRHELRIKLLGLIGRFKLDVPSKDPFEREERYWHTTYIPQAAKALRENPLDIPRPDIFYALDRRTGNDDKTPYVEAMAQYEQLQVVIARSVSEPAVEKRRQMVDAAIDKIFAPRQEQRREYVEILDGEHPDTSRDGVTRSHVHTLKSKRVAGRDYPAKRITVRVADGYMFYHSSPEKYNRLLALDNVKAVERNKATTLLYAVIGFINNPSDQISPLGRERALELLGGDQHSAQQFADAAVTDNTLSRQIANNTPDSMATAVERSKGDRSQWFKNPLINKLIARDGDTIKPGDTVRNIFQHAPEEAIQIALLFLAHREIAHIGTGILRLIPKQPEPVKARIFGDQASFLIEHKLAKGLEDQLLEAVGQRPRETDEDRALEAMDAGQLKETVLQERRRAENAEVAATAAQMQLAEVLWRVDALQSENAQLRAQVASAGAAAATAQERAGSETNQQDPQGYWRLLRLHPSVLQGLDESVANDMVTSHYRHLARTMHPDVGASERNPAEQAGRTEAFKRLTAAYKYLVDPENRAKYGQA